MAGSLSNADLHARVRFGNSYDFDNRLSTNGFAFAGRDKDPDAEVHAHSNAFSHHKKDYVNEPKH